MQAIKKNHTAELKWVLNLQKAQVFNMLSLKRYELLQSVARGDEIMETKMPPAKYPLAKHGDIQVVQAFLGIHSQKAILFLLYL